MLEAKDNHVMGRGNVLLHLLCSLDLTPIERCAQWTVANLATNSSAA